MHRKLIILMLSMLLLGCYGRQSDGAADAFTPPESLIIEDGFRFPFKDKWNMAMVKTKMFFNILSPHTTFFRVLFAEIHQDLEDNYGEKQGDWWYTFKNVIRNNRNPEKIEYLTK